MQRFFGSMSDRVKSVLTFSGFGAAVALFSFVQLYFYVSIFHIPAFYAKVLEAIVSILLNFSLNHLITYRNVRGPLTWKSTLRAFRLVLTLRAGITVPLNQALFFLLTLIHIPYLAAQFICLIVTYFVNLLGHERFIYAGHPVSTQRMRIIHEISKAEQPKVCIIIPCKNSRRTIAQVLASLLDQTYENVHIICVGNEEGDNTWPIVEQFARRNPGKITWGYISAQFHGRDAQAKRNEGYRIMKEVAPDSRIIAYTDSDNVAKKSWIEDCLNAMIQYNSQCIGGGMESIAAADPDATFWDRFFGVFTDATILAKTPRVASTYTLTDQNFGIGGKMPFVTANLFLSRDLLDWIWNNYGPLFHEDFTDSYEDYQAAWTIVRYAQMPITMVAGLENLHYHRLGISKLTQEYYRSGQGCRRFVEWAPEAPLSKSRLRQLNIVIAGIAFAGVALVSSLISGLLYALHTQSPFVFYGMVFFPALAIIVLLGVLLLGIYNAAIAKYPLAVLFPPISIFFVLCYCAGMVSFEKTIRRLNRISNMRTLETPVFSGTLIEQQRNIEPDMDQIDTATGTIVPWENIDTRKMDRMDPQNPDLN